MFVVVDIAGDIHSLNRQVTSAKAKDIREKIADIDPASLPDVAEAQEIQEQRRDARRSASGREEAEEGRGTAETPAKSQEALPILAPDDPALAEARADLNQNHERRREIFAADWEKRIAREMDLVNRQINEQRDIERKVDWKQMEPGKGIERFEHKLKDRLDPKRISDRYDERQQREKERDVRDAQRREARMPDDAGELLRSFYLPGVGDVRVYVRLNPNEMDLHPDQIIEPGDLKRSFNLHFRPKGPKLSD